MQVHSIVPLRVTLQARAVGIGEYHTQPYAREALKTLIRVGEVDHVVMEMGGFEGEPVWNDPKFETYMARYHAENPNTTSFRDVIMCARDSGVQVHAWETRTGSSPKMMVTRNRTVAAAFVEYFGGHANAAPRTVILFGAEHFGTHGTALNTLIVGLDWIDMSRPQQPPAHPGGAAAAAAL